MCQSTAQPALTLAGTQANWSPYGTLTIPDARSYGLGYILRLTTYRPLTSGAISYPGSFYRRCRSPGSNRRRPSAGVEVVLKGNVTAAMAITMQRRDVSKGAITTGKPCQ